MFLAYFSNGNRHACYLSFLYRSHGYSQRRGRPSHANRPQTQLFLARIDGRGPDELGVGLCWRRWDPPGTDTDHENGLVCPPYYTAVCVQSLTDTVFGANSGPRVARPAKRDRQWLPGRNLRKVRDHRQFGSEKLAVTMNLQMPWFTGGRLGHLAGHFMLLPLYWRPSRQARGPRAGLSSLPAYRWYVGQAEHWAIPARLFG